MFGAPIQDDGGDGTENDGENMTAGEDGENVAGEDHLNVHVDAQGCALSSERSNEVANAINVRLRKKILTILSTHVMSCIVKTPVGNLI